jgi:hypothetical protein
MQKDEILDQENIYLLILYKTETNTKGSGAKASSWLLGVLPLTFENPTSYSIV